MAEHLWVAELNAGQLAVWLRTPRTAAPFTILERLTAIDFPGPDEIVTPSEWDRGRIFGPDFELSWQRSGEIYHTRLIGERSAFELNPATWAATTEPSAYLDATEAHQTLGYLWGGDEVRIARPLHYRAVTGSGGRVRLHQREFRRVNGKLVHVRYVSMDREVTK